MNAPCISLKCASCGDEHDMTIDEARELGRALCIEADAVALWLIDADRGSRSRPTRHVGSGG